MPLRNPNFLLSFYLSLRYSFPARFGVGRVDILPGILPDLERLHICWSSVCKCTPSCQSPAVNWDRERLCVFGKSCPGFLFEIFYFFFIFQAVLQKLPQVLIIANLSCILIGSWTVITAKTHIGNEEQRRAQSSCWVNKVESAVQRIGHKNHAITAATLITFTARDLRGPLHSMGVVRSGTAWKLDSAQAPAKAYE